MDTTQKRGAVTLLSASPNSDGWLAGIHAVVLRIGRHLGFQAFNLDPRTEHTAQPTWTPATIFLVTDHLHHLLVSNYMRRDKAAGTDTERFERAVHRLHAAIFQAYRDWAAHCDLPCRLPELEHQAMCQSRGAILEWEYLLEELALYFLIYSEAANLRHMPEALWFLFWVVRNSVQRISFATGFPGTHPRSANVVAQSESQRGMIRKQLHLRNRYHREIDALRASLDVKSDGDYKPDAELASIKEEARRKLALIFPGASTEVDLLVDMVAYGDSGAFLDKVVEPVFSYLAETVDKQGSAGLDIQWRVAYDDANESLCSKERVHAVLATLGVTFNKRRIRMERDPYETLLSVGEMRAVVTADDGHGAVPVAAPQTFGWGWKEAANWWDTHVFAKTFIERRSWLSITRAFYRVWLFLILEFQAMCVFLWADKGRPWAWPLSDVQWYWLSSLVGTHAVCSLVYQIAGAWTQRATRKGLRLHGNPFWKYYARGILDWGIIIAVLVLAFVAQQLDFIEGVPVWWYLAGGYTALVVLHAVLSQRDGYTVSLTHSAAAGMRRCGLVPLAWLFEWLGASSARPPAEQYLAPYHLKTGWQSFFSNMLFWTLVLGAKCTFDWFAVMQTMKLSVQALMDANWMGTVGWDKVPNPDPTLPPIWVPKETGFDLDVILAIARVLPGFLVVMNDGQVFYYVIGALFGVGKGLVQLNLGSITSFQELVLTFHKAPVYWWRRCMSKSGQDNIASTVQRALSPDSGRPAGGGAPDSLAEIVRKRTAEQQAQLAKEQLVSEQIIDATSMLARSDSKLAALHLQDSALPIWLAFSDVWNGVVKELRAVDLVSNAEAANLSFAEIKLDESTAVVAGMRPIMLPIFFYGGQVARALEAPGDDPTQGVVLTEIRSLLVYTLSQAGIVTPQQAAVMASFQPLRKPASLNHRAKRSQGVDKVVQLLTALKGIMAPCPDLAAEGHRSEKVGSLRGLLLALCDIVDTEAKAVVAQHRKPARGAQEADASRLQHQHAANMVEVVAELRAHRLEEHQWRAFWGEEGALDPLYAESPPTTAKANVQKVVEHLNKMLTTSARGAQPRGEEAQRVLSFFMASLKNPTLETPPAVDDMLSWNVLTPHYEEDVLYALNAKSVAAHFGLPVSSTKGMSDLMSENEDGVTVMAWLRSNYPLDWDNLLERLKPQLEEANLNPRHINEADFDEGGPMAGSRMELQYWASYRGQLLARTVRGMMAYEAALRLLARIENPNPGVSTRRYATSIDDLVRSKFTYVVASQNYGNLRKAPTAKGRWLARGVEYLLHQHVGLRVAFLDSLLASGRKQQYAVLIRARHSTRIDDPNNTEELYRVRLPTNRLTDHGVILGEGKPENQNASIIFCFGEVVQAIDMNQDNYLCEALKMRNLINEFNGPDYTDLTMRSATSSTARRRAGVDGVRIPVAAAAGGGATAPGQPGVYAYERPFPDMHDQPVALVGFREWIFSQDSGALASFAAATEFTFGSIIQRIMTWPGACRFHYGHPDLWNKLFVMTRGGVSKATRAFHISEDVFAGYNHVLRGGRVKFKEYISCGKGRDMGFDSINSFESKVSSGNGEQVMSRDVLRLGTQLDFFRLLSFYHSGPGFFINSYLVLLSVYANLWMLVMLALTNTQMLPNPDDPTLTINTLTGQSTSVAVQQVVQIGMFSIITFAVEMVLEYGVVKALATLFMQVLQGSLAFFVFRSRTTAYFFLSDVQYGGAKYIPTGRGYSLRHQPFVKVYSNYARSHLYYAAELLLLLILLALLGPVQYAATTWSTWLVTVSILWAPFWFNPGCFQLEKTKDDFEAWLLWMGDVVDPEVGSTWDSWNKAQLEKPRNDRGGHVNPLATMVRGVLGAVPTAVLTLGAVTNMEDTRWDKWIVFGVMTAVFWCSLVALVFTYRRLVVGRHYRIWRLVRTTAVLALLAFFVCAIIFIPSVGSGVGLRNVVLIIFANFSFASVVTQALLFMAPNSLSLRGAVDSSYRVLDYVLGYFLFLVLFVLSLLQVFNAVQGALLYNIKFSRKLDEARTLGSNNYVVSYVDRATERINNSLKKELERGGRGTGGGGGGSTAPMPSRDAAGIKQA